MDKINPNIPPYGMTEEKFGLVSDKADLIDRSKLINRLFGLTLLENGLIPMDAVIMNIQNFPSAQPEREEFEWCHGCKEYDQDAHCCHRFTKVIRDTRRELQDEFVMAAVDGTLWVTVDDVSKVNRVIVDEGKSKFCKTFYQDAQPEQRWIPCSERLPEELDTVLMTVYRTDKTFNQIPYLRIGYMQSGVWYPIPQASAPFEASLSNYDGGDPVVTAWMPLPKPYQPE